MSAQLITRVARTFVQTLPSRFMHTNTIARQPLPFFTVLKRMPKAIIVTPVLATVSALALANEDVVGVAWKGASFLEKNKEGAMLNAFGRQVVLKKF